MSWTVEPCSDEFLLLENGEYRASTPFRELADCMAIVANEHEKYCIALANAGPIIKSNWHAEPAQILQFQPRKH